MSRFTSPTSFERPTETTVARAERIAGVAFVVLAAEFLVGIMLAAAMAPAYELNPSAISDLGVMSETALLFNASLGLVGALNIVGGLYLYRVHGKRWLLGVFVLAGIGAIGTGVFPLDSPTGLHGLFALVAFLAFNLEAIGVATVVRGPMRVLSVLAGVVGLVFLVVMAFGDAGNTALFGPIGHGGTERMIVYPPMVWLLVFGGYLLARSEGDAEPASRLA
ncbi:DUF998 domain-containing protein [Haloarchaeobius amylolyticus]|uniref:DUF998 domain-containing protein n=1 Tax=Haloarchaeobius amylolyticus TaxID=1198296 RepID=UPI00227120E1|nr:DUF998 domain-containing protein [Haloarchaeobius amylolyticus]